MKIICAPDSFKDSLPATRVAAAMGAGISRALPDAQVDLCPVADGGEGTLDAFLSSLPGRTIPLSVCGPLGERVAAAFGLFDDGQLAVVESALASGLQRVPPGARDPERTTSYGSGELLAAACASGAARIVVGIGGSATSDGGCGLAQALGVRFFDAHGDLIAAPLTGAMLDSIARIDSGQRLPGLAAVEIVVASDVQSPLTGPQGAAAVYGPQKGATPEQVRRLDAGLTHLARRIREDLGLDIEAVPGSGAAGGMGAGLVAFANARLASGIETVLEVTGFARRVAGCDLCLTGEGRIDSQSLAGKACIGVAQAAAREDVRTVALVGARGAGWEQCLAAGLAEIRLIGDGLPEDESLRRAEALIATAAGAVALQYRA